MRATTCIEQSVIFGEKTCLDSTSPKTQFGVVFEDDGQTGYFYALDLKREGQQILDALCIYDVSSITSSERRSLVQILWSEDGMKAALLMNSHPHAVFDFQTQHGWCRTGFPVPSGDWSREGHHWDEKIMALF
jgi:hypothetical protein